MHHKKIVLIFCVVLLAVSMISTGCARQKKGMSPQFAETDSVTVETAQADKASGVEDPFLGDAAGQGFEEGELPVHQDQSVREKIFAEASLELKPIYFDYDKSVLKAAAKAQLERAADWLKKNPKVNCQIEGHCDERGANEYNLALGERRALAARRYLVSLGINPDRLFTISYGEERAAVEGHDESAWKFNRRDEFKISF